MSPIIIRPGKDCLARHCEGSEKKGKTKDMSPDHPGCKYCLARHCEGSKKKGKTKEAEVVWTLFADHPVWQRPLYKTL